MILLAFFLNQEDQMILLLFYLIGMFIFYSVGYVVLNVVDADSKGQRTTGLLVVLVIIYPITLLIIAGVMLTTFWNVYILDGIVNLFSPTTKKEN